jgi:hypothetical protein
MKGGPMDEFLDVIAPDAAVVIPDRNEHSSAKADECFAGCDLWVR